jgi:aromatic ring-opening dioxygenase catalytic subunit (LigB family)
VSLFRKSGTPLPTLYLPHGGGPCFFMDWPPGLAGAWDPLAAWLRGIAASLPAAPRAIVVVSAHWEAPRPTVTARADPPLIYDYSGFPAHTYALRYAAPGAPEVAARVQSLLRGAGIPAAADEQRGFDHGVFVPFLLLAPNADIPIVQLSLVEGLDPAAHLAIGRALEPLRHEGVLLVGSGMSYHNLGAFMRPGASPGAESFDTWLHETLTADGDARQARLSAWERAPSARLAHPREEHLLPLMVAAGAAPSDPGARTFHDRIWGTPISGYQFG